MLLPEMIKGIEKVLAVQQYLNILNDNPFVFGISGLAKSYMPGHKAIRNVVLESECREKRAFTASNLRKYLSTEMVFLNIGPAEKEL